MALPSAGLACGKDALPVPRDELPRLNTDRAGLAQEGPGGQRGQCTVLRAPAAGSGQRRGGHSSWAPDAAPGRSRTTPASRSGLRGWHLPRTPRPEPSFSAGWGWGGGDARSRGQEAGAPAGALPTGGRGEKAATSRPRMKQVPLAPRGRAPGPPHGEKQVSVSVCGGGTCVLLRASPGPHPVLKSVSELEWRVRAE